MSQLFLHLYTSYNLIHNFIVFFYLFLPLSHANPFLSVFVTIINYFVCENTRLKYDVLKIPISIYYEFTLFSQKLPPQEIGKRLEKNLSIIISQ